MPHPSNAVFRFVSVRPPEPASGPPFVRPAFRSPLLLTVIEAARAPDARARARRLAREFISSQRYATRDERTAAYLAATASVDDALRALPASVPASRLAEALEPVLGEPPGAIAASPGFRAIEESLWDSLYATAVLPSDRPSDREALIGAVRVAWLVRLAADAADSDRLLDVRALGSARPVIPPELFPTPAAADYDVPGDGDAPADGAAAPSPAERLLARRDRLESARAELDRTYRRRRAAVLRADEAGPPDGEQAAASPPVGLGQDRRPHLEARPRPGVRPPVPVWRIAAGDLGAPTREILDELGVDPDVDDVPQVLDLLAGEIGTVTARLLPLAGTRAVRRVGSTDVYQRQPQAQFFNVVAPQQGGALFPGIPPAAGPAAAQPAPEQPYRVLGVGDLIVARETLLRYEAGEVAHIENVLSGELKSRLHRRTRQVEETEVLETERAEVQERDLQTTDRFELQRESQTVVQSDVDVSAGLSVSASYGFVSVTANADFAYNSSRQESNSASSTYARSVTERATSRIEERVREQRTRRTLELVEETNRHRLDATERPEHVRGVYQWVDKVYSMQLVNYGQRLMLEFLVPEPAAFVIFAQRHAMLPEVSGREPIPPEELGLASHRMLTADTFPVFVAAYGVADALPPPPPRTVVATAYEQQVVEEQLIHTKADIQLVVPEGYRAGLAAVAYSAPWFGTLGTGYLTVGNNLIDLTTFVAAGVAHRTLNYEDRAVPVAVVTGDPAYTLTVEIECELTAAAFEAWQLETYTSIVSAYRARKAEYDEQVARARVQQGVTIGGRNPQLNRRTEREELKKACLTMLTGSRFEEFSGIRENPSSAYPDHPEIAIDAVADAADRIQFLEQAFEWDQLTYLFYPYFWGRKQNWLDIFPLDDIDPKFAEFLRAGAARVVVPVPIAYADAVLHYLATAEPWNGGPALTVDSDLYRSVAAEVRRRQGDAFRQREGTVDVRAGSRLVDGSGTAFTDDDVDREIRLDAEVHRIVEVVSLTRIQLSEPFAGADRDGIAYSVGPTLVDQPWLVRVPTSLVYLADDDRLP